MKKVITNIKPLNIDENFGIGAAEASLDSVSINPVPVPHLSEIESMSHRDFGSMVNWLDVNLGTAVNMRMFDQNGDEIDQECTDEYYRVERGQVTLVLEDQNGNRAKFELGQMHDLWPNEKPLLSEELRKALLKDIVRDRMDLISRSKCLFRQVIEEGIKGFKDFTDAELIKAAVDAGLGISLADAGFDETGNPLLSDWLMSLLPGSEVYWVDPADLDAIGNTMAFHDLSSEFWCTLSVDQKAELAREAGENWPGSSGLYTIVLINTESGKIESRDSVVVLKNEAGSEAEVFAHELVQEPDGQPGVWSVDFSGDGSTLIQQEPDGSSIPL